MDWEEILKVMADESRLYIIHELLRSELSVNQMAGVLDMKGYNVSRHLKILEAGGLVEKRKEGLNRIYCISDNLRSRYSEESQLLDLGCCKFDFKYLVE